MFEASKRETETCDGCADIGTYAAESTPVDGPGPGIDMRVIDVGLKHRFAAAPADRHLTLATQLTADASAIFPN